MSKQKLIYFLGALSVIAVGFLFLVVKPFSDKSRPNLIIILIDTLRADHMSCYGYHRPTSPNIDRFAQRAVLFSDCFSSCPRTTQSMATIMTGRYPWNHGVRYLWDELPPEETPLAEILSPLGYETVAVIGTDILLGKINQGFGRVVNENKCLDAKTLTDHAIAELADIGEPYFLWIHYYDVHMSYRPPEVVFDKNYKGRFEHGIGSDNAPVSAGDLIFNNDLTAREREHVNALYDSEIYFVDRQVGRLINFLEEKSSNNIIVITADHGESLGENNYYYAHGDLLNQASLRVPLIISGIDVGAKKVSTRVRLIDVFPTILSALGIKLNKYHFDGVDLADYLKDRDSDLKVFAETGAALYPQVFQAGRREVEGIAGRLRSVLCNDQKLSYFPTENGVNWELYDLKRDPAETTDLYREAADSEIRKLMSELRAIANLPRKNGRRSPLTEKDKVRLRTLGYMQ